MHKKIGILDPRNSDPDRRQPNPHLLDQIPESAGPRVITVRGAAVHIIRPPGSHTFRFKDHFMSVVLTPALRMKAARESDKVQEFDAPVGMLVLVPANEENYVSWPSGRENMVVAITPESLLELAAHEFDAGRVDIQPPPYGTVDPTALHIAKLLKAELTRREAPNELYVDSLITMSGVHILRNYTGMRKLPPGPRGGLSTRSARRVREFLDVTFSGKISVAELAAVCGLSPRHFIQAFTKTFGEPPYKYLLRLRLDLAEKLLVEGDLSIAEVAHLSGFSDQSHLTATMSRYRNRTPGQLRLQR